MTEINSTEPLWVGMDVDAELARYAEEDRLRAESGTVAPSPKRAPRRGGLRTAIPTLGKGAAPQFPLAV
jgi:hypothetical protein